MFNDYAAFRVLDGVVLFFYDEIFRLHFCCFLAYNIDVCTTIMLFEYLFINNKILQIKIKDVSKLKILQPHFVVCYDSSGI